MGSNFLNYFMLNALFCPVPVKCMLDFMKDTESMEKSAEVLSNDLDNILDEFLKEPSMVIFHRVCLACAAVLSNKKISFSNLTDILDGAMKKCENFINDNQDVEFPMDTSTPLNMVMKDPAIVNFVDLLRRTYQIWNEMRTKVEKKIPDKQSSVEVELTVVLEAIDQNVATENKLFFMAVVLINLGRMVFFLKQQIGDLGTILKSTFMNFCFLFVDINSCVIVNHIKTPQRDILLKINMERKLAIYAESRNENDLPPFLIAFYQYAMNGQLQKQKLKKSVNLLCCYDCRRCWIHDRKKRTKNLQSMVQRLLRIHPSVKVSSNSQIEINAAKYRNDYMTAFSIFHYLMLVNMGSHDDIMYSENNKKYFLKRLKFLIINMNLFISILPQMTSN